MLMLTTVALTMDEFNMGYHSWARFFNGTLCLARLLPQTLCTPWELLTLMTIRDHLSVSRLHTREIGVGQETLTPTYLWLIISEVGPLFGLFSWLLIFWYS